MKLNYRGVSYDYTPPVVATHESDVTGTYRGHEYHLVDADEMPVSTPEAHLKYRGVEYEIGESSASLSAATPASEVSQPVQVAAMASATGTRSTIEERARSLMIDHHKLIKNREQTLLSRAATAIGLPGEAANYWSQIQGKINPGFRATYDRSHAALS